MSKRRRVDFTRPPEMDPNHPVPHFGWEVRQAVPLRPRIVYSALAGCRPRQLPPAKDGTPRGTIVTGSIAVVRRATAPLMPRMTGDQAVVGDAMPRRTVAHCLAHLERKGLIERWETESRHTNSPVTQQSWRIVPWAEVLQRWADDPNIATPARRQFYIWGKGKWHLTPEDVVAWKVDGAKAEADPAAHATAAAMEEPAAPAKAEKPAPTPKRLTVQEALIEDTAIVHQALIAVGVLSVEAEHAAALLEIARQVTAAIPAESVAALVHGLAQTYRLKCQANPSRYGWTSTGGPVVWNVGWFRNDMRGAAEVWLADQQRAQRATGSAR